MNHAYWCIGIYVLDWIEWRTCVCEMGTMAERVEMVFTCILLSYMVIVPWVSLLVVWLLIWCNGMLSSTMRWKCVLWPKAWIRVKWYISLGYLASMPWLMFIGDYNSLWYVRLMGSSCLGILGHMAESFKVLYGSVLHWKHGIWSMEYVVNGYALLC